uniref:Transmembrane 6 superfamily member 2b n=1 Tax=Oncorhynchus mykiss TaxID=8022 RepID=A0A8C7VR13_ONCMY
MTTMRIIIILSFTCVIDLVSSLEHDCFLSGIMEFYQKMVWTAIVICYWDGIVHFIMYLMMIQRLWNTVMSYHTLGLFWAGSLFANMRVFVTGVVVGQFGSDIRPAFWFNMPFLLLPIWGAIKLFQHVQDRAHPQRIQEACSVYLGQYEPYLKDPGGYPKILHFLFYMLPMLWAFVYGLIVPGCIWMPDWTVFECQASAGVCQWAHIGASLHPRTVVPFQIPGKAFLAVLSFCSPDLEFLTIKFRPYYLPIYRISDTKTAIKELHWTLCKLETIYPEAVFTVAEDFNKANLRTIAP